MGKDFREHKCPVRYRIKQMFAILSLFLSAEGRKVPKIFRNVYNIDNQLLAGGTSEYEGELAFFAVSESARGKGVGKNCFRSCSHI